MDLRAGLIVGRGVSDHLSWLINSDPLNLHNAGPPFAYYHTAINHWNKKSRSASPLTLQCADI